MSLFAVGKCWKRDGSIISICQKCGDRYPTIKVKKTAAHELEEMHVFEGDLKTVMEERSVVRRLGED